MNYISPDVHVVVLGPPNFAGYEAGEPWRPTARQKCLAQALCSILDGILNDANAEYKSCLLDLPAGASGVTGVWGHGKKYQSIAQSQQSFIGKVKDLDPTNPDHFVLLADDGEADGDVLDAAEYARERGLMVLALSLE